MENRIEGHPDLSEVKDMIQGDIQMESGEQVLGWSICRFGTVNIGWDSILVVTNRKLIMRPRKNFDAKRDKGIVTQECYQDIPLSHISVIHTKQNMDGARAVFRLADGAEIAIDHISFRIIINIIGQAARLNPRILRRFGIISQIAFRFGFPLLLLIVSGLGAAIGGVLLYLGLVNYEVGYSILGFAILVLCVLIIAGLYAFGPFAHEVLWKAAE